VSEPASTGDSAGRVAQLTGFLGRNRAFVVVWLAVLISIAGIGMVSPLLPKFAEDMGATGTWLGLIFSGYAFTQVPLMPVVGRLSDRFGKKLFLSVGLLLYVVAAAGYLWAPGYHELFIFRLVSGAGAAMVIPTAYAYIGDLTPQGREGRYMGIFNIAMVAGYGVGPMLGGLVYDSYGMHAAFASMCIMSGAGFLVVLLFLPGGTPRARPAPVEEPSFSFTPLFKDSTMRAIIIYMLAWGLAYGAVATFLPLFMTEVRGTSLAQVGIVLSVRSVLNGMLNYPYGWLADRLNRAFLVTVGLAMMAAGVCLIPWVGGFVGILILFAAMGIVETVAMPAGNAITVDTGRRLGMGSVMSLFNMANSSAVIVGAMVGATIESSVGITWVFPAAAGAVAVGAVAFNLFMRRAKRRC
jgi:DHA1 family multidrug resistance protein-like MFS transporter